MSTFVRVFDWVLQASWQASFLVLLILLVQWVFRARMSAAWRFGLWWLLVVRLVLPVSPPSPFSLFNVTGNRAEVSVERIIRLPGSSVPQIATPTGTLVGAGNVTSPRTTVDESAPSGDLSARQTASQPKKNFPIKFVLLAVWLLGGLVLGLRLTWRNLRFSRLLRRFAEIDDLGVNGVLSECKREMTVRTRLALIETPMVKGPSLFGLFRPKLLFPFNMLQTFNQEELRHIFLHELAHLKRRDLAVNWMMSAFCILHWFNPLIWLASRSMNVDRELACDELVLNRTVGKSISYGETMLKLLEGFEDSKAVPQVIGILENRDQMERRIRMIAEHQTTKKWPVLAILSFVGLALTSLTDAQQTEPTEKSSPPTKQGIVLREVWSEAGKIDGRISPDGRYFAFMASDGNLVVRDLEKHENRKLTENASWDDPLQFAASPVFSPDSQEVAYMWFCGDDGGELRITTLEGTSLKHKVLIKGRARFGISPLDWSPDGKKILATQIESFDDGNRESSLVMVGGEDGEIKVLKSGRLRDARFSPSGRFVAYHSRASSEDRKDDIFLFDLRDGKERRLIQHPAVDHFAAWAPSGSRLLFLSDRRGDTMDLFSVEVTPDGTAGTVQLVKPDLGAAKCLGMTKAGSFFYAASSSSVDLFSAELELSSGKMLSTPALLPKSRFGQNSRPAWSPAGTQLAYYSWRESRILCVIDWETRNERVYPLTPPAYSVKAALAIKWTLDGKTIGFRANQPDGDQGLFSVDLMSGKVSNVALDRLKGMVAFGRPLSASSPDGRSFQYIRGENMDDEDKLFVVVRKSIETGKEEDFKIPNPPGHRITGFLPITVDYDGKKAIVVRKNTEGRDVAVLHDFETSRDSELMSSDQTLEFRISPDGSRAFGIVWKKEKEQSIRGFTIEDNPPRQSFEVEVDSPNQTKLLSWTPDSRYMLFLKTVEGPNGALEELWTLDRDSGEMKKTELAMKNLSNVAIRPNGNQIVLEVTERDRTSIWAMENLQL